MQHAKGNLVSRQDPRFWELSSNTTNAPINFVWNSALNNFKIKVEHSFTSQIKVTLKEHLRAQSKTAV